MWRWRCRSPTLGSSWTTGPSRSLVDDLPDNLMFSASPERLRALADEMERDGEHELPASARRAAGEDGPPQPPDPPDEG